MTKTSILINGIYGWGVGFYSWEHSDRYDKVVTNFLNKNGIVPTIESTNGVCCQVGKITANNSIYFHAMDTVFKGVYNNEILINDFIDMLKTEFDTITISLNKR
jgi:hypothetical protein